MRELGSPEDWRMGESGERAELGIACANILPFDDVNLDD